MKSKVDRRPTFVVVGAAKSGTTSLYHYLNAHPQVFLPEVKEPHFFTADEPFDFPTIREAADYDALFSGRTEAQLGEASTAYLYFDRACPRIHAALPEAKIIALVRNPIDRALSMWGHQVREGRETLSFDAAIEEELRDGVRRIDGVEYGFNYVRLGFVHDRLLAFRETFGPDRVFIARYDELRTDPQGLMRRIFEFLEVTPDLPIECGRTHNASGRPRHPRLHRLLYSDSRLRRWAIAPAEWIVPKPIRHRLWLRLRDWNIRSGERHVASRRARQLLSEQFEGEIRALEELFDADLSGWRRTKISSTRAA